MPVPGLKAALGYEIAIAVQENRLRKLGRP